MRIVKTVNIPDPNAGAIVTFTLEATNLGPAAATGVVVTDVIPSGYLVQNVSPQPGTFWTAPVWTIGNLSANNPVTLTITAIVLQYGNHLNSATISANEPDPQNGNNSDNATVCIKPTLSIGAATGSTCGTTPVTVNGNNFGGGATAYTITHNGTGNLSISSGSRSPFSFSYGPGAADAGNVVTITVTTNNPGGAPCAPASQNYILTVFPAPVRTYTSSDITCFGASNGTVTVTTSGGTPPYEYSLNNGTTYPYNSAGSPFTITGLGPGSYQVRVRDSNGCETTVCQ